MEARIVQRDTGLAASRSAFVLLVAIPFGVVAVMGIVWAVAASRSGFWADDFLNLTYFARSLGNLANEHVNTGKYVINVFWAFGTEAFGNGSVVPFLLTASLVFAAGTVIWLAVGTKRHWSAIQAWWIGGLFIATGAWLPTALWSSNITHSGGFLTLGVGFFAHERCIEAETSRATVRWSIVSGVAFTLAVVSNLLYIGLLPLAAYCAFHQFSKIVRLGMKARAAVALVGFWNLVLPLIYFFAVAYPATKSSSAYAHTGLSYIRGNLHFYRLALAPSALLEVLYGLLIVAAVVGAGLAVRRKDWFPIALLVAAAGTTAPALVQSQQREIHYVAMPLLLMFSALGAGSHELLTTARSERVRRMAAGVLVAAGVTLILLFRQASDLRSAWIEFPYGRALATFRSQVAELAPLGGVICVRLMMNAAERQAFIAQMSGANGFQVPPISAAAAFLFANNQTCPVTAPSARIAVGLNARGDWTAAADSARR
jgi:hypothetical protein